MSTPLAADHRIAFLDGNRRSTKLVRDLTPLRAIRARCLDCSGGSSREVAHCAVPACPLFGYRTGHRPVFAGVKSGAPKAGLRAHSAALDDEADSEAGQDVERDPGPPGGLGMELTV